MISKGQVNKGKNQGEEEDSKDLLSNGLLDLEVVQANLLKNNKALTILITFGNLFIVYDQHGGDQENDTQEDTYEEHASVEREEAVPVAGTGLRVDR